MQFEKTVKSITDLLSNGDYTELVRLSNGVRLEAEEIEQAVKDYGQIIVPLPTEAYSEIDAIEIIDSNPRAWSVYVPIYTVEEGESDLTLELTLIEDSAQEFIVEIDNLHVL